jgi:hypothetical protein
MKFITLKILRISLFLSFTLLAGVAVNAIDPPPAIGGDEPPCGEPFGVVCPIDGGIGFLIAAAALYGGRKIYSMKSN